MEMWIGINWGDLLGIAYIECEKYELTWAGKRKAKRCAQENLEGYTLKLCPEKSVDLETTENLYIEGENQSVLKLLRRNYFGAVKMHYIDPPYNTGNDFIYRDNLRFHRSKWMFGKGMWMKMVTVM